jgi:GT2 family glycosyltransferase
VGTGAATGVKEEIEAVSGSTMPVSVAALEERERRGAACPRVGLVICTRNRSQQLRRALESLTALSCRTEWELVVVDNGSTDDTQAVIGAFAEKFGEPIQVVVEAIPGLGRGRNRGWRSSSAEIIAFMDDDCYPDPDYIEGVVETFDADKELGFVGGRILLYDPNDYPITIQTRTTRAELLPGSFLPAGLIQGANFAVRRAALEAVDGFDDRLGHGTPYACEDVDLIARISAQGWRGAYDPRPLVYHHHGRRTEKQVAMLKRTYDRARGAYYAKCLLDGRLRRAYLAGWAAQIRGQGNRRTIREILWAGRFLLTRGRV